MRRAAVLSCIVLTAVAQAEGQTQPTQIASAMAAALKAGGAAISIKALATTDQLLSPDEKAVYKTEMPKMVETALAATGQTATLQTILRPANTASAFLYARRPLTSDTAAKYVARIRLIDRATVEEVVRQEMPTSEVTPSEMLVALAFQEQMWTGGSWKQGEPKRTLSRLASLDRDAVRRWNTATREQGYLALPAIALAAVNGLFTKEQFQLSRFDTALPVASKLVADGK